MVCYRVVEGSNLALFKDSLEIAVELKYTKYTTLNTQVGRGLMVHAVDVLQDVIGCSNDT